MVNKSYSFAFILLGKVMWDPYIDYSRGAVKHIQCGWHICSGA